MYLGVHVCCGVGGERGGGYVLLQFSYTRTLLSICQQNECQGSLRSFILSVVNFATF